MIKDNLVDNYKHRVSYYENLEEVSYIIIEETFDVVNIVDVFTKEEYRRKGYSYKLFSYLINKYKDVKFMLEVRSRNVSAINLYLKLGFVVIYVRKKYYNDDDALIMEKRNFMKDIYILAIESSCDETSASIVKNGKEDIATTINTQIDIHKLYGGVVPEVASRLHLENITLVIDETLKKANMTVDMMDAIAVTYAPGLLGSLLVGLEAAKTLSLVYNKPFIKVNHMMGHILANNINQDLEYPLISLVISGGHTDLLYMENESSFKYIGRTLDDAVGECFDKVARILDMPYPGGPNIEKLASNGKNTYHMPNILNDDTLNFSFSGIKSHVNNLVHNAKQKGENIVKEDVARSFQDAVIKCLVSKSENAILKYNVKNFSICGGVASNTAIRDSLVNMCNRNGIKMYIPEKKYCTDNATMIGAAGYVLYKNNMFSDLNVNANSHEELDIVSE